MCRSKRGSCRALRVETLERRRLFAGDFGSSIPQPVVDQENPAMVASADETQPTGLRGDVNGDLRVSALDALMIVNRLNGASGSQAGAENAQGEASHYDVNLDGVVSAADALTIINRLSQQPFAEEIDEPIVLYAEGFEAFLPPPCSCGGAGCPACVGAAAETDLADFNELDTPSSADEIDQGPTSDHTEALPLLDATGRN